jgi:hypothetical protein
MNEQRTGLQKSITAIFAGATMPEEARPVCTHPPEHAKEAPPDLSLVGVNAVNASGSD